MTREEAVAYFKRHIDLYCVEGMCREAEEMAIKALEQEPCGKDINVPATDAISRQAVLEIVERVLSKGDAQFEIEQLPSVNPQPKTGHWIETGAEELPFGMTLKELTCSTCGWSSTLVITRNYCPKCGTKMVEPQESEGKG